MARVEFNPIIDRMTGKCGDKVYKMRNGRQYAAKVPDRSGHVATEGELANRLKFKQATAYARAILADPEKRSPYDTAAAASGRIAFNLIVSEFYQAHKEVQTAQTFELTDNSMNPAAADIPDISEARSVQVMAASCHEPATMQPEMAEAEPVDTLPPKEADQSSAYGQEVSVEKVSEPHAEPAQPITPRLPDAPAVRSRSRSRNRPRYVDRGLSAAMNKSNNPRTNSPRRRAERSEPLLRAESKHERSEPLLRAESKHERSEPLLRAGRSARVNYTRTAALPPALARLHFPLA